MIYRGTYLGFTTYVDTKDEFEAKQLTLEGVNSYLNKLFELKESGAKPIVTEAFIETGKINTHKYEHTEKRTD